MLRNNSKASRTCDTKEKKKIYKESALLNMHKN